MANKYIYALWDNDTDSLYVNQNQIFVSDKKKTILKLFKEIKSGYMAYRNISIKIYVKVDIVLSDEDLEKLEDTN